jgi:hypothetical protein
MWTVDLEEQSAVPLILVATGPDLTRGQPIVMSAAGFGADVVSLILEGVADRIRQGEIKVKQISW